MRCPQRYVALSLAHWLRRRNRGIAGFTALEVVLDHGVLYITVNDRLFGGLTPYAANGDADPLGHASFLDRLCRRAGRAGSTPGAGVLLWAPFGALALVDGLAARADAPARAALAVAVADQVDVESSALLLVGLVCGAVLLVAVVASPSLDGPWYAARDTLPALACGAAPLCAWGFPPLPRARATRSRLLTLAGTAALLVAGRF